MLRIHACASEQATCAKYSGMVVHSVPRSPARPGLRRSVCTINFKPPSAAYKLVTVGPRETTTAMPNPGQPKLTLMPSNPNSHLCQATEVCSQYDDQRDEGDAWGDKMDGRAVAIEPEGAGVQVPWLACRVPFSTLLASQPRIAHAILAHGHLQHIMGPLFEKDR